MGFLLKVFDSEMKIFGLELKNIFPRILRDFGHAMLTQKKPNQNFEITSPTLEIGNWDESLKMSSTEKVI
jgi:hypothetical protein